MSLSLEISLLLSTKLDLNLLNSSRHTLASCSFEEKQPNTEQLLSSKSLQICLPIPLEAPVTTATFP